jgi:hypothetical protein
MDIELNPQQNPTSSTNEEQVLQQDELTGPTVATEPEIHSSNNAPGAVVNTGFESQPQPQQDVAIDIDARFGPSCAPILSDADIVNSIITARQGMDCRNWLYLLLACVPTFAIMFVVLIAWAAVNGSFERDDSYQASSSLLISVIVSASITGTIFIWVLYYGIKNYTNSTQYELLRSNVRCVVKLEGDQWVRYVSYLYGSSRINCQYLGAVGGMSFCCRQSHYRRLIERGYGYIVFCQQGIILDEMFHIVRNQPHMILKVEFVMSMCLRIHLLRRDGKYTVSKYASQQERQLAGLRAISQQTVPLDIFLPNTIPADVVLALGYQIQFGL